MRKLPPRASRRVGGRGKETGVQSRKIQDRERADGRAKGNEGRKEVECMRSIACKKESCEMETE